MGKQSRIRKQVKHNPIAKDLRTPLYRKRIVPAKKGAGSYKRQKGEGT